MGNRTYSTINGIQTQYTVDANDRLTQQGGYTYTHDENGSTLTQTIDGVITSYGYNAKNEMVGSTSATNLIDYRYNAAGIRISQTNNGIATNYIVDSNRDYAQVLKEITPTESTIYTYGDDLISQDKSAGHSIYHYDGLGSTRVLTDTSGATTDQYDYEAFGDVLNRTGTTDNNYQFTGEQYDPNLDQYYLRARYYNQGIGRFTQMDTWMGNNIVGVRVN